MSLPRHWRQGVPLGPATSWRVGGPAEYLSEPRALPDLLSDLRRARDLGLPIYLLARGTNVLIDDGGLPGLVVSLRRLGDRSLSFDHASGTLDVAGGVPMPIIASRSASLGIAGFTFLGGIPGAVGAGVTINAGARNGGVKDLSDLLIDIEAVDRNLRVHRLASDDLGLGYRRSHIPALGLIVVSARLRATSMADPRDLRADLRAHLAARAARQPIEQATAGSVFMQPEGGRPAGWYLEHVGMKGYRCGRAQMSDKHANWIINLGGATSDDVRRLMTVALHRVHDHFGVALQPEVVDLVDHPWRIPGSGHPRSASWPDNGLGDSPS